MKKYQHKNRKGLWKNLAYGAVGLALLALLYTTNEKNVLKPRDFSKAKWIEFYNANGRIDSCYKRENISQNLHNWQLYSEEVSKRNNSNLKGTIELPDLDNDRKVGK